MSEFEDRLGAILADPEAMGQIVSMARSLTGEGNEPQTGPEAPSAPADPLGELTGDLDPALLRRVLELLQTGRQGDDRRNALLAALRPFLRPERQARIDEALRLTRLSRLLRAALGLLKPEEETHAPL